MIYIHFEVSPFLAHSYVWHLSYLHPFLMQAYFSFKNREMLMLINFMQHITSDIINQYYPRQQKCLCCLMLPKLYC